MAGRLLNEFSAMIFVNEIHRINHPFHSNVVCAILCMNLCQVPAAKGGTSLQDLNNMIQEHADDVARSNVFWKYNKPLGSSIGLNWIIVGMCIPMYKLR